MLSQKVPLTLIRARDKAAMKQFSKILLFVGFDTCFGLGLVFSGFSGGFFDNHGIFFVGEET